MRYSILGFNQEKVMQTDLDLTDLMLLQYIMQANGNPDMKHIVKDDVSYVWLSHEKILKDLPILRISEGTLRNRLLNLKKSRWIISVTERVVTGTKSYYSISSASMSFLNDIRCNFKMTSDNILIDNKLDTIETINIVSTPESDQAFLVQENSQQKPKKKNLWESCYSEICEFTEDIEVRDMLRDYLNMRLEVSNKKFGSKTFKGMLKKLRTLTDSKSECLQIIQQAIDRQYLTFYPIVQYNNKRGAKNVETISQGDRYAVSADEKEEMRRLAESGELEEY